MKLNYLFILCLLITLPGFSQEANIIIDKTGEVHPWSHLDLNNDPDNFQFAIVTDRTGGHRPGVFKDGVKKLNLLQPEFVMSVGDLIEGYTRDREEIYRQWDEFNGFIGELEMPFFYLPGNHDYINEVMAEIWEEKFGRSYYHFVYKDVLFLCLNSEEATKGSNLGGIEKEQYKYIQKVLSENQDVKWTLVFMHQPLWTLDNTRYWPDVEKLLNKRKHTVFVGHYHHYVKYERNNGKYFILATTGGASGMRGPDFGEFDHVVWVTMTSEGPVIANLLLDGIWDEDVVTERISGILSNNPLSFEPVLIREGKKERKTLDIKIVNDENVPLEAFLQLHWNNKAYENFEEYRSEVSPNNVKLISIPLDELSGSDGIEPMLQISAQFDYLLETGRTIKLKNNYRFSPSEVRKISGTGTSIKVDGDLSEWGNNYDIGYDEDKLISGDNDAYTGKEDLNFGVKLAWDEDYLYAAIEVKDDVISLNAEESVWRKDALRFYIDGRPARLSISGKEQKNGDDYIGIFMSPAESKKHDISVYQPDNFPEGTLYAAKSSENMLYYEIAIPATWLNRKFGRNWENVRLNFGLNDVDDDGAVTELYWKPEWRSEDNIIGSGVFEK